jgi:hypothetical protein
MNARPPVRLRRLHTAAALLFGVGLGAALYGAANLAIAACALAVATIITSLEIVRHALASHPENRP